MGNSAAAELRRRSVPRSGAPLLGLPHLAIGARPPEQSGAHTCGQRRRAGRTGNRDESSRLSDLKAGQV